MAVSIPRDQQRVPMLGGVAASDGATPLAVKVDDTSQALYVDVRSLTPGTGATNLGKAEDAAHASGDTGVMLLAVRQSTQADFGADGDYVPFSINDDGELRVTTASSSYSEDVATPATIAGQAIMLERDDALSTVTPAEGDWLSLRGTDRGALWTSTDKVGSVVDSNNSTTSTLDADGVYTGTGTDLLGYSAVTTQLYADVDSATDGMTFQFSTDNSNWDDVYTFTMDVSSSDTRRFQFPICGRYFRIVYTNGSGAQSAFRVQTILHTANQLTSIHRLVDDMSPDRSAQVMKTSIFAQRAGAGDFKAVQSTAGGNLKMSVQEISDGLDIGAGNAGSETQRVSISTDDVNLSAIKTAVELIDNVVSGSEAQVDVVAALPAGDNNIGNVDIASSVALDVSAATVTVDLGANNDVSLNAGSNIVGIVDNIPTDYELTGNTNHVTKYYTNAGAVTDGIVWSPAAGKRWYVTDLIINVSAAATVTLEDDQDGGDSAVFKAELAANSGISHSFNTPLFSGEDAADLIITTSAGNVYVCVTGYEV